MFNRTEYITWTDRKGDDHMVKVEGKYIPGHVYAEFIVGNMFNNHMGVMLAKDSATNEILIKTADDFNKCFVEFFHGEAQDWVNSNCKR